MRPLPGPGDLAIAQLAREERADNRRRAAMTDMDWILDGKCPDCEGGESERPGASLCLRCVGTGKLVRCEMCGEALPELAIVLGGGGKWCPSCAGKTLAELHAENGQLKAAQDELSELRRQLEVTHAGQPEQRKRAETPHVGVTRGWR